MFAFMKANGFKPAGRGATSRFVRSPGGTVCKDFNMSVRFINFFEYNLKEFVYETGEQFNAETLAQIKPRRLTRTLWARSTARRTLTSRPISR